MGTKQTGQNQITEGVIWKQILLFFFPIMLRTLFQQLYNTADAIVVGRFAVSYTHLDVYKRQLSGHLSSPLRTIGTPITILSPEFTVFHQHVSLL